MIPKPTQISGALFLSENANALLADEPRVGKTGAAIMAADYNFDSDILIVTTASGRPVWRRAISQWSAFPRAVTVLTEAPAAIPKGVVIVGWPAVANPKMRSLLSRTRFDRAIFDESHYSKNFEAKRTQAAYGEFLHDGAVLVSRNAIIAGVGGVWCLTGTPIPNAPNDLYPMMRALCPKRLEADEAQGWPDVTTYAAFLKRYCVTRPKRISRFRSITVVMGGRNLEELRARLGDFMLRRTQADVGIGEPIYETLPLLVSSATRRKADAGLDTAAVLAAAEAGSTRDLEMHMGPLRRLTGEIKARAVVEALREEFDSGLDKIVLMAWHTDVVQILREELSSYGVVGIDGATPANKRGEIEQRFLSDPAIRVFVGQIVAAGEAIDLSSAAEMIFVETSWTPKDMSQASKRITNYTQARQTRVRVAVLEGSIDEALQTILMRKWTAIREVMHHGN